MQYIDVSFMPNAESICYSIMYSIQKCLYLLSIICDGDKDDHDDDCDDDRIEEGGENLARQSGSQQY